jgi:hypothetical protein
MMRKYIAKFTLSLEYGLGVLWDIVRGKIVKYKNIYFIGTHKLHLKTSGYGYSVRYVVESFNLYHPA